MTTETKQMGDQSSLPWEDFFRGHRAVMLLLDPVDGAIVDANAAACAWYGWSREQLLAMRISDINTLSQEEVRARLDQARREECEFFDFRHRMADGSIRDVVAYSTPVRMHGRPLLHSIIQDVTSRKRMEALLGTPSEILAILSAPGSVKEMAQAIVEVIQRGSGCTAVGIRLREGDDYPFLAARGYAEEFLTLENTLLTTDPSGGLCRMDDGSISLDCTCGLVIRGPQRPDDPMFTAGGSVWVNDSEAAVEALRDADPRIRPRNRCVHVGFRSIALVPVRAGDQTLGLLHLADDSVGIFTPESISFFEGLGASIGLALLRRQADEELGERAAELRAQLAGTIKAMGAIAGMRDPYTASHERRVTALAAAIAEDLGLDPARREALAYAGEVHDIGKVAVPAEILTKPSRLNDVEFSLMKLHPETGRDLLDGIAFEAPVAAIVAQHHERLDGSGYPAGLRGDEIMPESLILAVADVVEAMSSHRPYRPGLGMDAALDEVRGGAGVKYDAEAVAACERVFAAGFSFPDD